MNLFDISPQEAARQDDYSASRALPRGSIGADWWQGIGTGLSSGAKSAFARDKFNSAPSSDQEYRRQQIETIEAVRPKPNEVGLAGQIAFGLSEMLTTGALQFSGGNITPQTAAMGSGTSFAGSQKEVNIKAGMDPATAESVARIEGAGFGLGMVAPVSVSGNLAVRALSGGAINTGIGLAQRTATFNTLYNAGYQDMARQYEPFESSQVITDFAIGGLFGGLLGPRAPKKPGIGTGGGGEPFAPGVKPSDLAAAMTVNNAAHVELGTAPGIPADAHARAAHVEGVSGAIDALMTDRPVQPPDSVTTANFIENPAAVQTRNQIKAAVDEHLGPEFQKLQGDLASRGLPTDTTLYNLVDRIQQQPVRVNDTVTKIIDRAKAEGWAPDRIINELEGLKDQLDVRAANEADKRAGDRVRGSLRLVEVLAKAERHGDISSEGVRLARWLIDKNPRIGDELAISLRDYKGDQVGGGYEPIERLATIFKGSGDPLTTVHEFLHHTERMLPQEVRAAIQAEWLKEMKAVTRMAEVSGSEDLRRAINDVLLANMGDQAAHKRLLDMVKDGLVDKEFYKLVNPSEWWAVNASRLVRDRAGEGWVSKAVQWIKELVEKAKDIFGLSNTSAVIRGLDEVLKSDGTLSGDVLATDVPLKNVDQPGLGVEPKNAQGFEPDLRVRVPVGEMAMPDKPLFTQETNLKNAKRQVAAIDEVLNKFPDADKSPLEWSKMMAYALKSDDVPVPPYRFLKDINSDGAFKSLSRLSAGQIADASHGFENAQAFRDAYTSKQLDVETTGKLFMWSFLSRGVSPYVQEGLFIDAFPGIDQWIKKAAAGELTEKDFGAYEAWAKSVAPQGSGQPGSGATHNLNAFGKLFLFKMGQKDKDGISLLQHMHNMMEDPNMTGQQIRRWFIQNTEGVGIDNKVVSFTLLVAGFKDVMVLDRVQIRQLWDDGRFSNRNLYDGRKVNGKAVAGSALSEITYGARGLMIYEAIERALAKRIDNIYAALGRPEDASIGRYHWETWVADSQQEASHGTLDAILHDAQGNSHMISEVTAKEGEYGAYAYGARYGRDASGTPYFLYNTPTGGEYRFTVPAFREFIEAVKSTKNKVVPSKFKVSEAGNAPWFENPQVNKQAIDDLARRYAGEPGQGEGARAVQSPGAGEAVSDQPGRSAGADAYATEELVKRSPALTYIGDDGTMTPASRALAMADEEIAMAQRDAQGYDAAVACALRG